MTAPDLSHGGVISLVGIQFVLNQLSQGGIIFVLSVRLTENKGMCSEINRKKQISQRQFREFTDRAHFSNSL